ncbi:MAG: TolC family protein [Opitutaceae bacterium]|nr:TolC family protein [Opitutaceae bacterium]
MSTPPVSLSRLVRQSLRLARALVLLCSLVSLRGAIDSSTATSRTVTIAVVRDGPSWLLDDMAAAFRQEAQALTQGRATLRFEEGGRLDAGWDDARVASALDAALADPAIDYVLALGPRATVAAADARRILPKPVLGALVQEADLVPLPVGRDGHPGKTNFAVVVLPSRAVDQIAALRPVVSFTSLHVLIDPLLAPDATALSAWREHLAHASSLPVTVVPVGTRSDEVLAALGTDTHAVLLFPAPRMEASERAALLQGLTTRKLPVLSFLGQSGVEEGALAGVIPNPRAALIRRLAINLDQLIAGTPVADLPQVVSAPHQLFFNETTASTIGFFPEFDALNRATLIGTSTPSAGASLTFTEAIQLSLERNFDLRSRQSSTEASREAARSARGALLPQLAANQSFQQIDEDRARASAGAQARTAVRAGLSLNQALLDDESLTRARIARVSLEGARHLEQAERLDTAAATGQAYLQLLSAQASVRVAEENLVVTQRNLDLAHLRQRVGNAGPEEGFRFESLAAQQRSDLMAARSQRERARVALNRQFAAEAGTAWQTQDVSLEDPAFAFTTSRVITLVRDRQKLERLRSFASSYALRHSPDLHAAETSVVTQQLAAAERQRRGTVPRVSASLSYARTLHSDQVGPSLADVVSSAGVPVQGSRADRDDWTLGVTASLPLFTGGSLRAEARKARAELRQREFSRDSVRDAVVTQTQSALYAAESSYASIALSRQAADLAAQNLKVVQDKYEQGTVSIVTLLDAQNSAFTQRQSAEVAIYHFLSDLLQFQRSLGWLEVLATPAEKETWFTELERAVSS